MTRTTRSQKFLLGSILLVALMLRLTFAAGMSGNDDLGIGFNAIYLLDDGFSVPANHYAARFGLILPVAGIFRLLGVGIAQLIALPMVFSLIGIGLAYRLGIRMFDASVGLWAAGVLAIYPMDVEFAGLLFPDMVQGTLLAGAFCLAIQPDGAPRTWRSAIAAGALWAWAYYVKIDSFIMGPVFGLAWLMGFIGFARLLAVGLTALALVGVEMGFYAFLTGHPLLHMTLDQRATNEVLTSGWDYRDFVTFPKAMFLTVYETGAQYFLLLAAIVLAIRQRARPTLLLIGWVLIFHAWLAFGFDPFRQPIRLKPQLTRYLMVYAIPASIVVGWFLAWLYRAFSRWLTIGLCLGAAGLALVCMAFNLLSYQAARATTIATREAMRHGWMPLYTDVQSISVSSFLMRGSPRAGAVRAAQTHDFLTGKTTFQTITEPHAFLLINQEYARRLERRNLVTPIDPARFGMRVTTVLSVDHPLPAVSYAAMNVLMALANLVPVRAFRDKINETATEVTAPNVAVVYQLDR